MVTAFRCPSRVRAAFAATLVVAAACARPPLEGTWAGRDEDGTTVVYSFEPGGTGYYAADGRQAPLTYRLREGYPNRIEIELGEPGAALVRRGLVRITWDGRMRLELGPPGGPAPEQLTRRALTLRQPATR